MKKNISVSQKNRFLILSGSILMVLSSCTKTVPFDALSPDKKTQVVSKSLIDVNADYIYSSSQQTSSMSAPDAFPFSSSDNKRVKLKMTENGLQVLEVERDQRYASNPNNDKLVIEIPVTYTQFECGKDKFGECNNTEVDNDKVPWNQRTGIKLQLAGFKSGQLDLLPIMESQTLGDNCYSQIGDGELVSSQIEADAINFQVKRTFVTNVNCLGNIEKLSDAAISAVYHYSLVKAQSVLSPSYKTISYPQGSKDENSFGFFTTSKVVKEIDHNVTDKSTVQIMNRWNPDRKEIVYYLSDEFAKPENKKINELTVQTVNNLNQGLEESGVNFRINLKQPAGKVPGDIRNSMIVLVEDPTAASVIGYGPQTEDPLTGEIFSARTVMFLGTIKAGIKYTYDDILRAKQELKALALKPASLKSKAALTLAANFSGRSLDLTTTLKSAKPAATGKTGSTAVAKPIALNPNMGAIANLATVKNELKNYTKSRNTLYDGRDLKSKFKYLNEVKNCAMKSDAVASSGSGISQKLMDSFSDDAKPWAELTESKKQAAIDIILPETWIPTLIHEMGHNLGLRHNFQGSEDKANFFNADELKARNIDHAIPFTSVMEYGDDLKALPVLGKYDIAALRFGYNREVDVVTKDGLVKPMKVETTIADLKLDADTQLKDYGYCTDENTGINAGCKRFDLGTTYTEITQNIISDYENAYTKRNFRNGRADMSLWDDYRYANRIGGIFLDLRIMMEVRERIKYRYGIPEGHPIWGTNEFLKDIDQASTLAGLELSKVVATPDTSCAVSMKTAPTQVIAVLNLKALDSDAISCFSADLQNGGYAQYADQIMIVGQTGKMFNSKKDIVNVNSYADQIDVRGYWIDKVLATNALFKRQTPLYKFMRPISTFDKNNDSFIDLDKVRGPALGLVSAMLNDNMSAELEFTLADGSKALLTTDYDFVSSQVIEKHMFAPIANVLGIAVDRPMKIQELVTSIVAAEAIDLTGANQQDQSIKSALSVGKFSDGSQIPSVKGSLRTVIGSEIFQATANNVVAQGMITNSRYAMMFEAIKDKDGNVDTAKIEEIAQAKKAGTVLPATATAQEKAVYALDISIIEAYIANALKSSEFYTSMLQILPVTK